MQRLRHRTRKGLKLRKIKNAAPISEPRVSSKIAPCRDMGSDLIVGANNSHIATLAERQSRFVILAKVGSNKRHHSAYQAGAQALKVAYPRSWIGNDRPCQVHHGRQLNERPRKTLQRCLHRVSGPPVESAGTFRTLTNAASDANFPIRKHMPTDGWPMSVTVRYLTHPQVLIEPTKDVRRWSLNDVGSERVSGLAGRLGALSRTRRVISSDETKALETASPLAFALGLELEIRPRMHENDRSATGFLPSAKFETIADQFFAEPDKSVLGWETACDAQRRILSEVDASLAGQQKGDVLFVGHGAVGTLLFCALSRIKIDRRFDQGSGGGGCWFGFDLHQRQPFQMWQPMEALISGG